jgi:pyruvate formate lyase activating enzyme
MDLKAPWNRYPQACGTEIDQDALRRSIGILRSSGIAHQLRTTDWAGFSEDERGQIEEIARGSVHVWQRLREP